MASISASRSTSAAPRPAKRDRELDRAIEWAFDPAYPVDEEAIAAAEEQAARQSMAIERLIETMARRRDEDDAIAVLLMVM